MSNAAFSRPIYLPEREAYINEFKDPRGHWTSVYNSNLVLMYNTRLAREKDAPRDYPDLLDHEVERQNSHGCHRLRLVWHTRSVTWGKDKSTATYMKQLSAVKI